MKKTIRISPSDYADSFLFRLEDRLIEMGIISKSSEGNYIEKHGTLIIEFIEE